MSDIYKVTEDTTVHVYEGMDCVAIYDEESGIPMFPTGFDRLDNQFDIVEEDFDKEWAKNRNREIEKEIKKLREILDYNGAELKLERVEEINNDIFNLLTERDENTFKYGLAGEAFNRLYKEKNGADTDGDIRDYSHKPNSNEARFKKITKEMVELYSRKNTDYGGSFDESLDEDGLLVAKIRLKDKLNRFSQLIDNDILVASESIEDTLIDLANYSIMTLMWINDEKD